VFINVRGSGENSLYGDIEGVKVYAIRRKVEGRQTGQLSVQHVARLQLPPPLCADWTWDAKTYTFGDAPDY